MRKREKNKLRMKEEAEFFAGLLEWNYGQKDFSKLKNLAQKVSWAQGWPEEKKAFWNAEAFMWQRKIAKEKRALIENELQSLSLSSKSGKILPKALAAPVLVGIMLMAAARALLKSL